MTPRWRFREVHEDGGLVGGDQAAMSFKDDLGVFVRETLQNSLDARRPRAGGPVRVRFALRRLKGEDKRRFLAAADWPNLRAHLEAAGPLLHRVRRAAKSLADASTPLDLLVLSDEDAVGLAGDEAGRSRFADFARHKLFSEKQSAQAGGSYGLGKSVLWSASSVSTIFFHTRPVDVDDRPEPPRLMGVSQLPFHRTADGDWDGPGWFGLPRPDHPKVSDSVRDPDAALLDALQLGRPTTAGSGTTFVVPAFAAMEDATDAAVAEAIESHANRWFWPALLGANPRLAVEIEVEGEVRRVDAAKSDYAAFAHLADLLPKPAWASATRRRPLELLLCETHPDVHEPAFRRHGKRVVPDALEVAVVSPEAGLSSNVFRQIALVRGAGMVVQYLDLRVDRPCAGLVRAGAALGASEDLLDVDQYLRLAEPPSHDEWTGDAPKLRDRYLRGYKGPLNELPRRIRDAAADLMRERDRAGAGAEIPAALRKALSIGAGKSLGPVEREGRFDFVVESTALKSDDGRLGWAFSVRAACTRRPPWRLAVVARIATDFGGEALTVERCEATGGSGEKAAALAPGLFEVREEHVRIEGFAPLGAAAPFADRLQFEIELKAKGAPRDDAAEASTETTASVATEASAP